VHGRPYSSKIVTIEVWQDLEIAHPGAASARQHHPVHPGTHLHALGTVCDQDPQAAEPGTSRRRDRSISSALHPSGRQDIIFALCSPSDFRKEMELREVPAREAHVDGLDAERFLIEANRQRVKTKVQRLQEYKRLKEIESALAKEREHARKTQRTTKANLPESSKGQARDKAAETVGLKPRTAEKGLAILKIVPPRSATKGYGNRKFKGVRLGGVKRVGRPPSWPTAWALVRGQIDCRGKWGLRGMFHLRLRKPENTAARNADRWHRRSRD
jgi:hypothetical protein